MATAKFIVHSRDGNMIQDNRTISNVNPGLIVADKAVTTANMKNIRDSFTMIYTTLTNNAYEGTDYIVTYDVDLEAEE